MPSVPVGTNLALIHLIWSILNGSFLGSRGAIFPALQESGFSAKEIRRSWQAMRYEAWCINFPHHLPRILERQWCHLQRMSWSWLVTCFQTNPLECTLLARWDEGYADPWLVLTLFKSCRCQCELVWFSFLD